MLSGSPALSLRPYISEYKPLLMGVDGGADALIEAGYKPDMIIGDMDSCSDAALACGAELVVHADAKRYWRLANPGFSYLCSNDPRVHFGLAASTTFESIEVLWPDGTKQTFPGGLADHAIELRKGPR